MMLNTYMLVVVDPDQPLHHEDSTKYRSSIEILPFATNCERYEIGFAVELLSRFPSKPYRIHFSCAKRTLRYVSGSHLVVHHGSAASVY